MTDPRIKELAQFLITYSCNLQKGENILIEVVDAPDAIAVELIRATREAGANPHVRLGRGLVTREMLAGSTDEQYALISELSLAEMKHMDAYIAIRGGENNFENSSVPAANMKLAMQHLKPVMEQRVNNSKWCVLRWPTPAMAQSAMMSTEQFEDFYFRCCLAKYAELKVTMDKLGELMMKTDQVRITGPGTDLTFSIKGMPAITCAGNYNIPDGEVYTAPIKDSVNGIISYNAPTVFQGIPFDDVVLEFKDGKIIKASCNGKNEALNKIFNTDEGARYVGEFAIGTNTEILEPMRDILFDEKIGGSFHFTPGQAYENCNNGNKSQIHWDLVCIQRASYGGGEMYFDSVLVRKDGIFIDPEFAALNPPA